MISLYKLNIFVVVLSVFLCFSTFSYAEPSSQCSSGQAAQKGKEEALEREKEQIDNETNQDLNISEMLQQCINAVVDVPIITFPSLDDIFKQIKDKICTEISREIQSKIDENQINYSLNAYSDTNARIQSINQQAQAIQIQPQTINGFQSGSDIIFNNDTETSDSDVLSDIWK